MKGAIRPCLLANSSATASERAARHMALCVSSG